MDEFDLSLVSVKYVWESHPDVMEVTDWLRLSEVDEVLPEYF
jgi:hypothetical protein